MRDQKNLQRLQSPLCASLEGLALENFLVRALKQLSYGEWKTFFEAFCQEKSFVRDVFARLEADGLNGPWVLASSRELPSDTITDAFEEVILETIERREEEQLIRLLHFWMSEEPLAFTPTRPVAVAPLMALARDESFSKNVRVTAAQRLDNYPVKATPEAFWETLFQENDPAFRPCLFYVALNRKRHADFLRLWPDSSENVFDIEELIEGAARGLLAGPGGEEKLRAISASLDRKHAATLARVIQERRLLPREPKKDHLPSSSARGRLKV